MIWGVLTILLLGSIAVLTRPLWRDAPRAAAIIAVLIAAGSTGLYAAIGHPDIPSAPYAEREKDPDFLVRSGNAAFAAGDMEDAVTAWRKAVAAGVRDGALYARLGEALTVEAGGTVTPEAGKMFAAALKITPEEPYARFFAGLAMAQHGDIKTALSVWQALKADSKPDAPWMDRLNKRIREAEQIPRKD